MEFIANNFDTILVAISSVIASASALCALIPDKGKTISKIRAFLDVLALNIGKAAKNA